MIRLLIAGAAVYTVYRIVREIIDEVPDDFDPLLLPAPDDDKSLPRQSAAMGVEPQRWASSSAGAPVESDASVATFTSKALRTKQKRCLMGNEPRCP
ncbi:MAG: hypothetical protein EOQ86_00160 [Mesorhizobium sp.]|uniref:hypothetical protein n=1 Tax=Mesorhizobium sp. TaxID=1871066 RepID=UPI000FE531EA|nr:hypothetical protein [Mesorhizobium sp.]RWH84217.1 MAG: hypothetical protein EOQ85_01145 [Mesorhizobium sp.]RWH86604.1 MAG: hypothetical protein EOQ86_00160 [Mesorhizobium sp.]RWH93875.1 MAG: hypothetical protein EOQ87_05060 [Mesorhizobium sp.]RWI02687.1 MAG: hypothetical protein EOQ88_00160 [Mesorhizobium sp.]RWI05181.1 MAG: hypothetical protein EOQ89_04120 [Mesorhizobium sp.]